MKVYGPYISTSSGYARRFVIRIYDDGTRKSTSYARHLMEEHLGRELTPEETVDHIDGDRLNDALENLQVMSLADNIRKSSPGVEMIEFECPVCGRLASKVARHVRHNLRQGKAGPFCGRPCARQHQALYRVP